jgi:signal peptidase
VATAKNTSNGVRRGVPAVGKLLALMFALLSITLVALALFARTDGSGVTRVAGRPLLTVLSDSMTPTFKAGDIVLEKSVEGRADELPVGTVITFRAPNGLVTHRIVRVEGAGPEVAYRTQGDANNVVDATPVRPDQVVGVYAWHVPYAGYVLNELRTPRGLSVLVFALALFMLLPLLASWWRAAGDETNRDDATEALEPAGVG